MVLAATYILRLKAGGYCHWALPCSSWVWISRGSSGRSVEEPRGNGLSMAATGNRQAARLSLLTLVLYVRRVFWGLEQPGSSLLPRHPNIQHIMSLNAVMFGWPAGTMARLCHV